MIAEDMVAVSLAGPFRAIVVASEDYPVFVSTEQENGRKTRKFSYARNPIFA